MSTCLTPFCTVKQNLLPLACLGVEGEESTKKLCNYCVLAQQQRAKEHQRLSSEQTGAPSEEKAKLCEYHCMDVGFSPETRKSKGVCHHHYVTDYTLFHHDYHILLNATPVLQITIYNIFKNIYF